MPERPIHFQRGLWARCLDGLRQRSGEHEAGAFLLGTTDPRQCTVTRVVYYDELDANAYSTGVCVLYADSFERLWRMCRERGLSGACGRRQSPTGAGQSPSDRNNPMVAQAGHVAIIVPNYARVRVWRHRLGLYRYRGAHQWDNLSGWSARHTLRTGTWT